MTRRISYKVFKDELADYIEMLSNPISHERLITLARESFNCKDIDELFKKGKKIFEIA